MATYGISLEMCSISGCLCKENDQSFIPFHSKGSLGFSFYFDDILHLP